jgi:hypothetical protein
MVLNMPSFTRVPLHGGSDVTATEPPSNNSKRDRHAPQLRYRRRPQTVENWTITRTLHALLVDWSEMKDASRQSTQAGFKRIIALCKASQKDEFVIENIAPDYVVGSGDPTIVIEAQERIVWMFMQAATTYYRELPEYRLSLRRGAFDLRFYVGRTRPTDYLAADELY